MELHKFLEIFRNLPFFLAVDNRLQTAQYQNVHQK